MPDIFERIGDLGVVPVVKIEDPADALPLADALVAGGLPVAEVTFRTEAAEDTIRRVADNRPGGRRHSVDNRSGPMRH